MADVNVLRITNFETLFWLNMIMRKFVAIVDDVLKSSGYENRNYRMIVDVPQEAFHAILSL